ncbi:TetR/AcrR family transcriptional regulator [Pseudohoeflea coraliihabitans]|uniref:TetR/AcrR family transcriptional regulator n=1 Tax=Pseudohoeflea coraliihabitans TaxID=2860393 RepID=UPI003204C47E
MPPKNQQARARLLEAARDIIRARGFAATSVDELCRAAGVTKGAFFHHFASKEALGVAAAEYWSETTSALFAAAPYHAHADPLDRFLAYLEFRRELLAGAVSQYTCLVGTMVQETHESAPAIRDACARSIHEHALTLVDDIKAAMAARRVHGFSAESLALHTQAVLQGAFILAKAQQSRDLAAESVDHLIRYVRLLFNHPAAEELPA